MGKSYLYKVPKPDYRGRKKIAVISNDAFSLINFRRPLIREMVKLGHEVYALAPNYTKETQIDVQSLGAKPISYYLDRTGSRPSRDLLSFLDLYRNIKRLKPDIVYSYTIKPNIYGILAASISRVSIRVAEVTGLGYIFIPSNGKVTIRKNMLQRLVKWLYRLSYRHATHVFFHNPDDLREFSEMKIVDPLKAKCIGGTGLDLEEWPMMPSFSSPMTFTLVGRLLKEKGIYEFISAAKRMKLKLRDVKFLLVGGLDINPGTVSLEDVENWVKEGIVEWAGEVKDVHPFLSRTSVFVLPSYREGVPRSTQEAMAMGRPVITTDAPGCRETVIDGVNGFLIPPRDVDALVEAMEKFILCPELIMRMGKESRKLAEERFDVKERNKIIMREIGLI